MTIALLLLLMENVQKFALKESSIKIKHVLIVIQSVKPAKIVPKIVCNVQVD